MVEITLNGPGKNALSTDLMTRTLSALRSAGSAPVLLVGEGDAFSAGLDLKELGGLDPAGIERFLGILDDLVVALFEYPGPTVAAINGHAIAGGCVLALCCDHRVATTNARARIGLNEVAIGLRFPPRVLALARARLGPLNERRVLLEGGLYAPTEALALGLCDELADDPAAAARARLGKLAAHDPGAYADAKAALTRGALDLDPSDARRYRDEVLPRWTGNDLRRIIAAVLGGR